ncbi:hypothetical protein PROFUN_15383 [Planoprotostelium fungivorum]|uniref:Uncharacterized protein n=1 Tax=Planoprotostelium fungivorum TaxID=1890364 RepID=A0A2P6MVE8_9EUKA|nr:hypothetical protein PROFUN_15383 [Planoprotostelium fungivorum]
MTQWWSSAYNDIVSQLPQSIVDCLKLRIQNTKIRGKKCELNEESDNLDNSCFSENSATKKHIQCMFIEKEHLGFLWFEIILYKQRLWFLCAFNERFDQLDQTEKHHHCTLKRQDAKSNMNIHLEPVATKNIENKRLGLTVRGTNINKLLLLPQKKLVVVKLKQDRNSRKCGLQMRIPKTKIFKKQPSQPRHPGRKDLETRDERFEQFGPIGRYECTIRVRRKSVVAECPHEDLMAEAEEEGFSNYTTYLLITLPRFVLPLLVLQNLNLKVIRISPVSARASGLAGLFLKLFVSGIYRDIVKDIKHNTETPAASTGNDTVHSLWATIQAIQDACVYLLSKMTDPNLPTMQTRINGLALSLAEKTWAQDKLTANPDLATTWTPETDVNLTAFIKQSATQSAPPALAHTEEALKVWPRNKSAWSGEGVGDDDPIAIRRQPTVDKILAAVEAHHAVLFDSPPYSGKTGLASKLMRAIEERGDCMFKRSWVKYAASTLSDLAHQWAAWRVEIERMPMGSYVIFDETQVMYQLAAHSDFWAWMKDQQGFDGQYRVILFSAWQSGQLCRKTPHLGRLQLKDIRLTREEASDLLHNFNKRGKLTVDINQVTFDVMLGMTNNHIGYMRFLLEQLRRRSRETPFTHQDELLPFVTNPRAFLNEIFSTVRIPSLSDLSQTAYYSVLQSAIKEDPVVFKEDLHTPLLKTGLFEIQEGYLGLNCLWLRDAYINRIGQAKGRDHEYKYWNPDRHTIESFFHEAWQGEFYRSSYMVLRETDTLSNEMIIPEQERSGGRLDFWINNMYRYGFELIRGTDGLKDHVGRFSEGGSYYPLVTSGIVKEWRIINFRSIETKIQFRDSRMTFACYDHAQSQFVLKKKTDGKISEYAWQGEFYRSSYMVLRQTDTLSNEMIIPEQERSGGRLDFWINNMYGYGFELLRGTDGLKDHVGQFSEGGSYYPLVTSRIVKEWRIINFWSIETKIQFQDSRMTFACYNHAQSQFVLKKVSFEGHPMSMEIPIIPTPHTVSTLTTFHAVPETVNYQRTKVLQHNAYPVPTSCLICSCKTRSTHVTYSQEASIIFFYITHQHINLHPDPVYGGNEDSFENQTLQEEDSYKLRKPGVWQECVIILTGYTC